MHIYILFCIIIVSNIHYKDINLHRIGHNEVQVVSIRNESENRNLENHKCSDRYDSYVNSDNYNSTSRYC